MKISRTATIICFFTYIASLLCFIVAILFAKGELRLLLALPYLPATIWYIYRTRCPHCRRFGLRIMPFAQNAGYCNYCGERIDFSE